MILTALNLYIKDCYHDRLMKKAQKIGCVLADGMPEGKRKALLYTEAKTHKIGSLFAYIKRAKDINKISKMFAEDETKGAIK